MKSKYSEVMWLVISLPVHNLSSVKSAKASDVCPRILVKDQDHKDQENHSRPVREEVVEKFKAG